MQNPPVATVINFCSNEARFIDACITEAKKFSRQIVIPVCDHFFNGKPEDRDLLESIYRAYPDCLFLEYPFVPEEIPRRMFGAMNAAHFWHNCSRLVSVLFLDASVEAALFLDADEIPDGKRFLEWLATGDYQRHTAMKFSNYWYFREPRHQALTWEDSIVLARVQALNRKIMLDDEERNAIYDSSRGRKQRSVNGADGLPMFHHFSWVRTKQEMLQKVQSWGHKDDRNWTKLVENEFSQEFGGTDFVHGYQFKTVVSPFDIRFDPPIFRPSGQKPNIIRLTQTNLRDLLKFKRISPAAGETSKS